MTDPKCAPRTVPPPPQPAFDFHLALFRQHPNPARPRPRRSARCRRPPHHGLFSPPDFPARRRSRAPRSGLPSFSRRLGDLEGAPRLGAGTTRSAPEVVLRDPIDPESAPCLQGPGGARRKDELRQRAEDGEGLRGLPHRDRKEAGGGIRRWCDFFYKKRDFILNSIHRNLLHGAPPPVCSHLICLLLRELTDEGIGICKSINNRKIYIILAF